MKTHTHPMRDNDQIWGHFDDAARRGFARAAVPQEFFPQRRLLARRRQCGLVSLEVLKRLQRRALDLRLPNLGSSRAQRMIIPWATLAPRLFRSATTLSKRMSLTSAGATTPGPSSMCT